MLLYDVVDRLVHAETRSAVDFEQPRAVVGINQEVKTEYLKTHRIVRTIGLAVVIQQVQLGLSRDDCLHDCIFDLGHH